MSSSSVRFALRDATSALHARVDAAFAAFDLTHALGYARFLSAHARAAPPLEQAVMKGEAWSGWRGRIADLRHDLAAMDTRWPEPLAGSLAWNAASAWGVQYVLEGSKLGGQMVAARLPPALPHRYLSGGFDAAGWRRFQQELNLAGDSGGRIWLETAVAGARAAFAMFEDAVRVEIDTVRG